jgi:beta-galactosidase/beta-glucuronidase
MPANAATAKAPTDVFAEIGAREVDYLDRRLEPVEPEKLPERFLPLDAAATSGGFTPAKKITTPEQLRAELERQRQRHEPFLRDLAPALTSRRIQRRIESFDWRIETGDDRADFGSALAGRGKWEKVKIPHYGGPMGRVATLYRTEFEVTPAMQALGALFMRFKGVDYKAQVFVNGAFTGAHEGIFAPFEFDVTAHVRPGKNVLLVKVLNDFTMLSNSSATGFIKTPVAVAGGETVYFGEKIYAAVGPCWDEPGVGWHCCPPGMGIYQDVFVEARRRIHVHDIFVRPLPEQGKAEAWIEVFGCDYQPAKIALQLSLFGQNFAATNFTALTFAFPGVNVPSVAKATPRADLAVMGGINYVKVPVEIPKPRLWQPETPWLYQLQVKLLDEKGELLDTARRQFGMRSFRMDYGSSPKGAMFLNGQPVKLRGANTMGALQQCVIRRDWAQLRDDILLAKITRMNYMRLTQMPVQEEVYDYCDRLGLMVQTDLPLFGEVRRTQSDEVVRQAGEMERLVRAHPSCIQVTYINEPFPSAHGRPQRNLTRGEMTDLFASADRVVRLANPDRVIKAVDGDYDPPGPGLPDNHCYTLWYNGHGVEWGRLHKGFWMPVKPGWLFGCGEFGIEGLDFAGLMRRRYPKDWLPQSEAEEKTWTPDAIPGAQTGTKHQNFFETPRTFAEWIERGQAHQAWGTRFMTEAFRRQNRMHSFAIHLFIDAFPASWMKSIMDYERQPKPAWFAYRDALTPLAVQWRSDRRAFFAGETMNLEAWLCNDLPTAPDGATLRYHLELDGKSVQSGSTATQTPKFAAAFQGFAPFKAPNVPRRVTVTARIGLVDREGRTLHDASLDFDVFPKPAAGKLRRVRVIGDAKGKAAQLARDLGCEMVFAGPIADNDAVLLDDVKAFRQAEAEVCDAVKRGARAVFLELPAGPHRIAENQLTVSRAPNGPLHFASRATGHNLVHGFQPEDFKLWYDATVDRITPLLLTGFTAPGWEPVLTSFDKLATACKPEGQGQWCICQVALAGRTAGNPVAEILARRLLAE